MDEQLILLYSKYSASCAPILDFLRRNEISGIRMLCIDNRTLRAKLLNSKSDIKTVPCFLMVRNGRVSSKLEGEEAHIWFSSFTNRVLESRAPPPPPPPPPAAAAIPVAPKVTPIELPAPVAEAPPKLQRTPVEAPSAIDMDDIITPAERMTVSRSVPDMVNKDADQMAADAEGEGGLKFSMSMKHDPHRMRENQTMENMLEHKDEMASRKKLRGPIPAEATYSDMPIHSERDMIQHEATAARATGGNKSEEIKNMVEEMRRGREIFDNQMAESDGVPLDTLTMRRQ